MFIASLGALLAALIPMAAGVLVAEHRATKQEQAQAEKFADAAIARIALVTEQANQAIAELNALTGQKCDGHQLDQIRRVAARYRYVHDAGIYQTSGYLCSAMFGAAGLRAAEIAAPDWVGSDGTSLWLNAPNPMGGRPRVVIGRSGKFVAMDSDSFVDTIDLSMRKLAAVNIDNGKVFATSPGFEQSQVVFALKELGNRRRSDGRFVTKKSGSFPLAVVVENPDRSFLSAWTALLSTWCLSGAIAGIGCGALVLRSCSRALSLEGELNRAVRRRDFEVHYQPIVDLRDGRNVGAEALVRWRRGANLVPPDKFIPVAEGSSLIQAITDEVLRIVLLEMREIFLKDEKFFVSINVSARDMCTPRFLDFLTGELARTGFKPGQIRIEVTEREIIDKNSCLKMVQAFRKAGHLVYIDDFGTGYSNLSYLEDFAVDMLKIDRTFTRAIGERTATSDVTRHIVAMAEALGLAVVAEGIETVAQAHYLKEIGVEYGQGWLFAPGRPFSEFQHYLATDGKVHGPTTFSMVPASVCASSE